MNRIFCARTKALLVSEIPIMKATDPIVWATALNVVCSVPLCIGDYVDLCAETQIENPVRYEVEIVTQVLMSAQPMPGNVDSPIGAIALCPAKGANANRGDEHYLPFCRAAKMRLQTEFPNGVTFVLRGRARSTVAVSGDMCLFKSTPTHMDLWIDRPD